MLVDTGVLFAAISGRDKWHGTSVDLLLKATEPLITTTAVMTELFHFCQGDSFRKRMAWALFSGGKVVIADITQADLPHLDALMLRYDDRPMDFADATLVHVAGRENISSILTIDHDDFETYRFGRNRKFRILPPRH